MWPDILQRYSPRDLQGALVEVIAKQASFNNTGTPFQSVNPLYIAPPGRVGVICQAGFYQTTRAGITGIAALGVVPANGINVRYFGLVPSHVSTAGNNGLLWGLPGGEIYLLPGDQVVFVGELNAGFAGADTFITSISGFSIPIGQVNYTA